MPDIPPLGEVTGLTLFYLKPASQSVCTADAPVFIVCWGDEQLIRQAFKLKVESVPSRKNNDRRSDGNRRKTFRRAYFLSGGKERRSWQERRYIWDMTR